jgi:hypothetical protein
MRIISSFDWRDYLATWGRFWYAYHTSHRIDELQRLIQWAQRKRLTGVRNSYRYKLVREMISLKGCRQCYPETTAWGRGLYKLVRLFASDAPYYPSGAAAAYRTAR